MQPIRAQGAIFFGRQQELSFLNSRVEAGGATLLLEGDPGIGKTRLVSEFVRRIESQSVRCRIGGLSDLGPSVWLRHLLNGLEQDLKTDFVDVLSTPRPAGLDLGDSRNELFLELTKRIALLVERDPFVFVVDDLQWADEQTLRFLDYLSRQRLERLLMVLTLRSGPTPVREMEPFQSLRQRCDVLALEGLPAEETQDLFESLAVPIKGDEARYLHRLTGGNPLFVSELASHFEQSAALMRLALPEAVAREQIPESVTEFLDSLLEHMGRPLIAVLEAASCIGLRFRQSVLEEVCRESSISAEFVDDALHDAWDKRLIRRCDGPDADEYEFFHPLLRERIYRQIRSEKRRVTHRALALLGEKQPKLLTPEQLAVHAARGFFGEEALRATEHCMRAALVADEAQAFEVATEFWALALSKTPVQSVVQRGEMLRNLALSHRSAGNWAQAKDAMIQARDLYLQMGRPMQSAEAALFVAQLTRFQMELDECLRWAELVLDEAPDAPHLALRARALIGGVLILHNRDPERGLAMLQEALAEARSIGSVPHDLAYWTSLSLYSAGRFDEARAFSEAGLQSAKSAEDHTHTALIAGDLILSALQRLDLIEAERLVDSFNEIPEPLDIIALVRISYMRAVLESYKGNWRGVEEITLEWSRQVRLASPFQRATPKLILAEALSALGDAPQALQVLESALPDLEQQMRGPVNLHRARLLLQAGRADDASRAVSQIARRVLDSPSAYGARIVLGDLVASLKLEAFVPDCIEALSKEPRGTVIVYVPVATRRVLGKLYAVARDYGKSYSQFDDALQTLAGGGACYELALTCIDYAVARAARNKRADQIKAETLIARARALFAGLGLPMPAYELPSQPGGDAVTRFGLTRREAEVLVYLARGETNREIAQELGVTPFTVARHIEGILPKIGAANRTDAARIATAEKLI